MRRAIALAEKGTGLTSPNPTVGAVIVKDGIELGSGWHRKAGEPHAEREAIADALVHHSEVKLKGSTIYVTLEPCSTKGRTHACTDGILAMGISKVVYGAVDPNPDHAGAADKILKQGGIEVVSGVCREECERLLRPFSKRIKTGLPWVIAKTAMSLDGRTTRPPGEGQWLSNIDSRALVHQIRARVDAIIVGGKTARIDNPRLTIRCDHQSLEGKVQPWRVVLTHSDRTSLPKDLNLFTDEFKNRTLVYCNKSLEGVLSELASKGCNTVLLECGGQLMRQFAEQELIDEYHLFYAPLITSGEDLGFSLGAHFSSSTQLTEISSRQIGNDTYISGVVQRLET